MPFVNISVMAGWFLGPRVGFPSFHEGGINQPFGYTTPPSIPVFSDTFGRVSFGKYLSQSAGGLQRGLPGHSAVLISCALSGSWPRRGLFELDPPFLLFGLLFSISVFVGSSSGDAIAFAVPSADCGLSIMADSSSVESVFVSSGPWRPLCFVCESDGKPGGVRSLPGSPSIAWPLDVTGTLKLSSVS